MAAKDVGFATTTYDDVAIREHDALFSMGCRPQFHAALQPEVPTFATFCQHLFIYLRCIKAPR